MNVFGWLNRKPKEKIVSYERKQITKFLGKIDVEQDIDLLIQDLKTLRAKHTDYDKICIENEGYDYVDMVLYGYRLETEEEAKARTAREIKDTTFAIQKNLENQQALAKKLEDLKALEQGKL